MANMKELCSNIESINNVYKITKAMEMVSASKMRKSRDFMMISRPYADNIQKVIDNLLIRNLEYNHPYIQDRKVKRVGYFVISSDRGLCSSLNINLFKKILEDMQAWSDKNINSYLAIVGSKGVSFFSSIGASIIAQITNVGDKPALSDLIGLIQIMLQAYDKNEIDRLYISRNNFISTIHQNPTITQLLPLKRKKINKQLTQGFWDYLYEPDPKIILKTLLNRYIESQVYFSVIENIASEQAARTVSMKTANENCEELIKKLKLLRNKVRQEKITQEITEIISGADAV